MSALDYKSLFLSMGIPRIVVSVKGEKAVIVEANEMAEKYLGKESKDLKKGVFFDHIPTSVQDNFLQAFDMVLEKRVPVSIKLSAELPSKINVPGFQISPIENDKGEVSHLDVIGQFEIFNEESLQRERDDAVSLLMSMFDVSEIGIVVTDTRGQIIQTNKSFTSTYGWDRDDLVKSSFFTLITPDEREIMQGIFQDCLNSGQNYSGELKMIRKDGHVANVLATTTTLELSQKRRYQVITATDITLRKRMEESLRNAKEQADSANRSKSMFLANMSHELRTPLNAIIGFSELMYNQTFGALGNDKYIEYCQDIFESATHLLEIINEVLDMSKIEAGHIEIDEEEFQLHELLHSVTRMMVSRAFTKNITIDDSGVDDDLPIVYGDERLLRQVFINIINNAIKFSKSGERVEISARKLFNHSIEVVIQDYGRGIAPDQIEKALEPFGQISERADKTHEKGTGLGLPLAKAMVDIHEGELSIESELGKGTKVIINLPAFRVLKKL